MACLPPERVIALLMVCVLSDELVIPPPMVLPAAMSAPLVRTSELPYKMKELAPGLKPILPKMVPAVKSLVAKSWVEPSKKRRSLAATAVPPQLAEFCQLPSGEPPPVQVLVAAKDAIENCVRAAVR